MTVRLSRPDKFGQRWTPDRTVRVVPQHSATPRGGNPRIDQWQVTHLPSGDSRHVLTLGRAREEAAAFVARDGVRMTPAAYEATCRKIRDAHAALLDAQATAEYDERIALRNARAALQLGLNALRVQVCTDCTKHGSRPVPGAFSTYAPCRHPSVPGHDLAFEPGGN